MSCELGVCQDSLAKKYISAVLNPFSKNALGAQVPDLYSFPTVSKVLKTELKIRTDADGNMDFTLLPSLFQSILTGVPSGSANSNINLGTTGSDGNFQITATAFPTGASNGLWNLGGVSVPSFVNGQFSKYRIVGWGARVRALIAPINQRGRLIFASNPSSPCALFQPNVGGLLQTSYADVCKYFALPTPDNTGYLTTELLNTPDAISCMLSSLSLKGGMQWVSKHTSAESIKFNSTSNLNVDAGGSELGFGLTDGSTDLTSFQYYPTSVTSYLSSPSKPLVFDGAQVLGNVTGENEEICQIEHSRCFIYNVGSTGVMNSLTVPINGSFTAIASNLVSNIGGLIGPIPMVGWGWEKISTGSNSTNVDLVQQVCIGQPQGYVVSAVVSSNATNSIANQFTFTNSQNITFTNGDIMLFYPMVKYQFGGVDQFRPLYNRMTRPSGYNLDAGVLGYTSLKCKNLIDGEDPLAGSFNTFGSTLVDPDFINTGGWSSMSCRGYGLPENEDCLSLELIFHIEGPPVISGTLGALSNGAQFPYVDTQLMNEVLLVASQKPHFQSIDGSVSGSALTNEALN